MKQFLLLILLLPLIVFPQENTNDTILSDSTFKNFYNSEAERLIDKYSEKIVESFNSGVKQIVPIAEEGFKISVKLQIAKGITNLIPITIFIISLFLIKKEYLHISSILKSDNVPEYMNKRYGPLSEDNINIVIVVYIIILLTSFLLSLFCTHRGIMQLYAPEWFAIQDIIELFN